MAEATETISACPRCGAVRRVSKCECSSPPADPVTMPYTVAARLRELHRKAFPPYRLTASPAAGTVWVERDRLLFRPKSITVNEEAASGARGNWVRLTPDQWTELRDAVDRFFEATNKPSPGSHPTPEDDR